MIEIGPLITNGGWCKIFAIDGNPDLCAKILIPRRYFKGAQPDPNTIVSTKYGITDFLDYEWNNYRKIMAACPENLRRHFVTIHGVEETTDGRRALIMEKIVDDRNEIAPSLVHNARPLSPGFFAVLERLRQEVFLANSIDHFGIVRRNILVRGVDDPVLIDFQTGRERYKWQFWLRHPWFVRKKINRCFHKLYTEIHSSKKKM